MLCLNHCDHINIFLVQCLQKYLSSLLLCDVDIGEAVGLITILEYTSNLQFDNIDFALEYKKGVDAFRTDVNDNSEFGCIVDTCRQLF